jgi:protein involved in polysaccharide export with SLBB domain
MRGARLLLPLLAALAVSACARQQQTYVMDPNTGQPVPVMSQQQFQQQQQQQYAQAPYVQQATPSYQQGASQQGASRGLYSSSPAYAQQSYAQQPYGQQAYAQQTYAQPQAAPSGRGLLTSRGGNAAPVYVQQPQVYAQQPYGAPRNAAPRGGPYVAAPNYGYASANPGDQPAYTLDSGDKLRVVVFGQDGITNSYMVDAGGNISLPLVGIVPARGSSTAQLGRMIAERLKQGYVREPHVSVEVEAYRPFFILGEVTNPGQYPYVANMSVETAVAIAGGFAPRAAKKTVELSRTAPGQQMHGDVPLNFPLRPGDTVVVKERWF